MEASVEPVDVGHGRELDVACIAGRQRDRADRFGQRRRSADNALIAETTQQRADLTVSR